MPLRHEDVGDDDVFAARAPHAQGMPGIQDGHLVSGEKHEALDRLALVVLPWLVPLHNLGDEHEPVTIMAPAGEGPLAAQAVAAVHRARLPTRCERACKEGRGMTVEDLRG